MWVRDASSRTIIIHALTFLGADAAYCSEADKDRKPYYTSIEQKRFKDGMARYLTHSLTEKDERVMRFFQRWELVLVRL